ncbi:hypothetical protein IW261DRAFT_1427713 [Armillaria novae-zelandiae]|uniref:Uncharacterized protein n=1 Tax=Armillaria novae-zelandiae TaxID=153914 RepID=A0AA39NCY6_9AGAR|nr:hypothetical protein IW261DRAFT_1427713 [Armillaria novae-zelandiae]
MHIEDEHLHQCKVAIADTDTPLALQIAAYRNGRECFYAKHMQRFYVLSKDIRFTGSITVGRVVVQQDRFRLEEAEDVMNVDDDSVDIGSNNDGKSNDSDNEESEKVVFEEVQAMIHVLEDNERC